jgi:hypothetical protein
VQSGRLFRAPKLTTPQKQVTGEAATNHPKGEVVLLTNGQAISVLLVDAVSRKAFAFTQDSWFQVAWPLKPHDFKLPAAEGAEPDRSMNLLRQCVRATR